MPAVTSPRGYPYPLDGDPINVAGDIQKLAVKIDDDVTAVLAAEVVNNGKKYDKTGGAITGNVTISGATTMSGALTINATGDQSIIVRGTSPYISFYNEAGTVRDGYIRGFSTSLQFVSDGPTMTFSNDATGGDSSSVERFRIQDTTVLIGKSAPDLNNAGIEFSATGSTSEGRCSITTMSANALANLVLRHIPSHDANNAVFLLLQRSLAGTTCGQIRQLVAASNNCNFDAGAGGTFTSTSDYRLKDDLGPVDDAAERLMRLQPKHLRWLDTGDEFDGFIAHEVADIVPSAVVGEKDAVFPDDHPQAGEIDPQAFDPGKLVPLLTAALQDALTRIAALESAKA